MQIFLSYASEDKAVAEPIAFSLRARGHQVFLDRDDLPAGGEYDQRIEQAVEKSGLFIFLISPQSVAKGRFTLSEVEFARRKWRKADGHVLPVLIAPTPMQDVPSFLKAVTILEPKGNVPAEVAAAVEPLVKGRHTKGMFVLGGLALLSGLATHPLLRGLPTIFPDVKLHNEITLSMLLTGGAFALALLVGLTVLQRFDLRMLLIPVGVLLAWFLAMEATITVVKNWRPEAANSVEATELRTRCDELAAAGGETSDPLIAQACETLRLADASSNLDLRFQSIQQTAVAYGAGGLVGGFLTVVALLLALPKRFTLAAASFAAIVGAVVASAVMSIAFHYDAGGEGGDVAFQVLFTLWQPAVAVTAARMIR